MTNAAVVEMPLTRLHAWSRNPRRISSARLEQLKRAIIAEPEMLRVRPLIALPDGTVIMGNQRLRAARELGWKSIPVVVVDLDEARAVEWALRDNRAYGDDDEVLVAALLGELQASGRDIDLTGYDAAEADRLLATLVTVPDEDPDDAPPLPAEPCSRRGEVYELGPHRLLCGDATNSDDVALVMGNERAALVFTSPPYLDLRDYGGVLDLDPERLASFLPAWREHADLIAVNLGLVFRDHAVIEHWNVYLGAARAARLKLLAWNVWNREEATNVAAQRIMFPPWHEFVFVFGQKPRAPNRMLPTKHAGERTILGQRQADGSMTDRRRFSVSRHKPLGSVLTLPSYKGRTDGDHPAVFPVALPCAYMYALTRRGELVADPFAGSGTTLIAAEQTGRRCRAIEIKPGYCDVIRQRYADFTGRSEYAPGGQLREAS
jgi:DNA modification methylase